ncbi:type II secretion system secretin GspD [Aliamphritea ceti]|uniref:type II secretion system secretin GspD n=1 Tax=Aliamphritea ceti TaxID=1524258 RepID=UPI0021C36973|nr:type II secretion system secretin GspD [Aliamphritea ceti]
MNTIKHILVLIVLNAMVFFSGLATAEDYTLNMQDVEIRDFINTIAKLTEKTIIIDEKVKGRISIESPKTLSSEDLYEIFLVQLSVKGYTVIDNGTGILKVIPAQGAKLQGAEVGLGIPQSNSEKIITQVIEVKNVNSNQLAATLRPLVDAQIGVIAAYATSNVILVTDRATNVKRISKIIQEVDRADSQRLSIIKLNYASATELERTLNNLTQRQGAEQSRTPPIISADTRTNTLIIRADLPDWLKLKSIIEQLDSEVENTANHKVIYLKYANAGDLLPVLKGVSNSIVENASSSNGGQISASAPQNVTINAHEQTNAIIISGDPSIIKNLESIISNLDIRRAQVMVEAIIAEITDTKARELGIQWLFGSNNNYVSAVNFPGSGNNSIVALANAASQKADTSGFIGEGLNLATGSINRNGFSFAAFLQALATDKDTNILSTPNLVTLDNEEASILVGQEIPVITGSTTGSDNNNPYQTIERKDVGIKLTIKPQINEGSAILLKITQEVSSVSGLLASDIVTNKRVIDTTVLIDDGSMIALGGLMTDEVQETYSKVPVLGDIPLLGKAFRSDQTKREKRNLMVFLRPKVLLDQASATQESRKKYQALYSLQQQQNIETDINLIPGEKRPALPSWDSESIAPSWYGNQPLPNAISESGELQYVSPETFF